MIRVTCLILSLLVPLQGWAEQVPAGRSEIALSFAPLVKQAAPAVVNIYARRVVEGRRSPLRDDPFFSEFFRSFSAPRPRVQNSLGSGVILSSDGIVVSNYHVVGDATDIRVVLNDRREYGAEVLLADEEADLAILQLYGAVDMPVLPLRDSDEVEVGELVLAIGNPFGVGQTVSSGIVSGLARSGTATGSARGYFIQTDAPINPGNSGGALIDNAGRLIGVNTSILTRSGGSNGIGFAIPANLVARFVDQARAGKKRFERPWSGLSAQPVTSDLAAAMGLDFPEGIAIAELHPSSPFAEAGFMSGDILATVEGQEVSTEAELEYHMAVRGPGARIGVERIREGERETLHVPLIAPPEVPARDEVQVPARLPLAGLLVANSNPALLGELGQRQPAEGVIVWEPGPIGARLGLRPGDHIVAINGAEVRQPADVPGLLAAYGRAVSILIERDGRRLSFQVRL
ncbi:Do/DeqQ family serine protease [Poseidonocella pacifica]|uniref:Do/DeqQ family serine protease n=1 Tax=Poseidonocella pacifica TaxID=871651 RepID=A0A1I0XHU3_9RHOB|nr:trypsin-like peptidase domain-containing protein [Poseidonocella pacifica]SFB00484.1 Do/DeqQ family serine protease [Poseidonocella pacifica]